MPTPVDGGFAAMMLDLATFHTCPQCGDSHRYAAGQTSFQTILGCEHEA
jgi:hypothetical protein